jgi:hypothetical protein
LIRTAIIISSLNQFRHYLITFIIKVYIDNKGVILCFILKATLMLIYLVFIIITIFTIQFILHFLYINKKDIVTIWKVLTKDKYMLEYIDQILSNKGVWE